MLLVLWGISALLPDSQPPATTESATDSTSTLDSSAQSPVDSTVESLPLAENGSDSSDTASTQEPEETAQQEPAPGALGAFLASQEDTTLGKYLKHLLEHYNPDGAFYLVVDPASNKILAWAQKSDSSIQNTPTYLSKTSFPAASLIKALTAGAAMEYNRYSASSGIPLIGRAHTLYKRQLVIPQNYNGPRMSLEDAFAKSANPIFGIIGQQLGGKKMRAFAEKMGFNVNWPHGTPEKSNFSPPDRGYALAEAASGFTESNTISPLQAAAISRSVLEQSPISMPWSDKISQDYAPQRHMAYPNGDLKKNTLYGLKKMFLKTVTKGTARRSFKRILYKYNYRRLNVGGKTGTLDGSFPRKARYDWFMGFAQDKRNPDNKIVVAVMQYHFDKRTLSSPQISGLIMNEWAKHEIWDKEKAAKAAAKAKAKAKAKKEKALKAAAKKANSAN